MIQTFPPQSKTIPPRAARLNVETRPHTLEAPHLSAAQFEVIDNSQLAALDLYRVGFNVFPLVRGTKDKHYSAWKRLQTTRLADPTGGAVAREQFKSIFKNANVAIMTGRTSRNLVVLDCETLEALELHRAQFERRGFAVWIVRTARGGHLYFLSAAGELANMKPEGAAWELRARACYVLAPPSIHPTGAVYEWLTRAGNAPPSIPLDALDWLGATLAVKPRAKFIPRPDAPHSDALAALSKTNRDFCENGASAGSRATRLFRAAADFAGNQIEIETARPHLLQGCERSAFDKSFTRQHAARIIQSAYSKPRTAARVFYGPERKRTPLAIWKRAAQFADAHQWQNIAARVRVRKAARVRVRKIAVSAQTARSVFEACIERARQEDTRRAGDSFRAAVREIAELANIERGTAYKALHCLTANEYLQWQGATETGASLYTFGAKAKNAPKRDSSKELCTSTVAFWRADTFADVFRRGALSRTAGRVWLLILENPLTVAQIAARLNVRSAGTIRKAVKTLAARNLARRVDRAWMGENADRAQLERIAETCATRGKAAQRKERHRQERAADVTAAFLRVREKEARRALLAELREGGEL